MRRPRAVREEQWGLEPVDLPAISCVTLAKFLLKSLNFHSGCSSDATCILEFGTDWINVGESEGEGGVMGTEVFSLGNQGQDSLKEEQQDLSPG